MEITNDTYIISPSIMCARSLLNIKSDIDVFIKNGIKMIHVDIMDNHFVSNLVFGPDIVNELVEYREKSNKDFIIDVHMMVENPLSLLPRMKLSNCDYVTIHAEIQKDNIKNTIEYLHEQNIHAGIAINPKTSITVLQPWLDDIDLVLFMFIEPGFKGARPVQKVINKIKSFNINIYKEHNNILKAVDGGITLERAQECKNCGVNIYIGGTSSLYKKNTNKLSNKELEQNIVKINFIINNIVKTNE